MTQYAFFRVILVTAGFFIAGMIYGCKDSGTMASTGTVSMTAKYLQAASPAGTAAMLTNSSASGVDSIEVTAARFVLARVKFETEDEEADFRAGPFVFQLNLSGALQNISVAGVPFGTYEEVKFKIHRIDSSEVQGLPPADLAMFADFLADGRYSMIIDGTVFKAGLPPQSFTFRSREDASQKVRLSPPLVINSSNPTANVTLTVNSYGWFRNFAGGLIDPTDSTNTGRINENLEHSFKIFCDRDRDGRDDHDEDRSGEHDEDSSDHHDGDGGF